MMKMMIGHFPSVIFLETVTTLVTTDLMDSIEFTDMKAIVMIAIDVRIFVLYIVITYGLINVPSTFSHLSLQINDAGMVRQRGCGSF